MQAACQPVYVRSSGLAVAHVSSSPYWRGATLCCCRLGTAAPTLPFWQRKETDSYSWTIVRVDLALLRCQFQQILVMVRCDLHGCSFSHIWIWICFRCDLGNFALLWALWIYLPHFEFASVCILKNRIRIWICFALHSQEWKPQTFGSLQLMMTRVLSENYFPQWKFHRFVGWFLKGWLYSIILL